jgi:hypothetical protein
MAMDFNTLRKKHRRAVGEAKPFWEAYKRAAEYAAPSINTFGQSKGGTKSPGVNTSQALQSTNAFICEFISALTPPNRRWAELQPTTALVEEIVRQNPALDEDSVRAQLDRSYENITRKFFECLDSSNFYDVLKQFVLSIGIGTGCMLMNELDYGRDAGSAVPFEFIYVPVSNLSIDAGNNNKIYGVFRDMRVRRQEIPELWFDGDVSGLEEKEEYNLIECCVYDPEGSETLPWVFCVFDSDEDVKVVQDRRLPYNPYIVFRWSTVEGESLGRGPILEAMADIQSLNRLWETYFAWVQRNSLGITLVRNSELAFADLNSFENFDFQTGKLLPVNDPANFVPLKISGDLSSTQFLMAEFVRAIRQQLLDIELPTVNTMTAYETRERANRILRLMAGLVGRINLEFIEPFFKIGLRLMEKYKIIRVPPEIGNIKQFTTKIVLQSPLSRSQQMADIDAARVALETLNLVQTPIATQYVNMERFVGFVWVGSGAPAKLLNSQEEAQQIRQSAFQEQIAVERAKRADFSPTI